MKHWPAPCSHVRVSDNPKQNIRTIAAPEAERPRGDALAGLEAARAALTKRLDNTHAWIPTWGHKVGNREGETQVAHKSSF